MMKTLLFFTISLASLTLNAQETPAAETANPRWWKFSIGAGVAVKKNLRVGNTYEDLDKDILFKPIPIVQGSIGRLSLGGQGLSFMAFGNPGMNLSAHLNQGGDRYHGLNMTPRKDTIFAGLTARVFKYGFTISKDIRNSRSKGFKANFNYGEMFMLSPKIMLRTGISVDWFDDLYSEYYYSVRNYEATATRREYHLNNYFQPALSVLPIFKLSEKSSVIMPVNLTFIPDKVRHSPTMNGDKFEYTVLLGYSYDL